jgi:hypothetical protein
LILNFFEKTQFLINIWTFRNYWSKGRLNTLGSRWKKNEIQCQMPKSKVQILKTQLGDLDIRHLPWTMQGSWLVLNSE